jgi:prepilin-type N-terminal cleavage/methylation domain-containing protein
MRQDSSAGFSLLEVLAAMALIGIALAVIIQLFSANLIALSVSEDYSAALARAEIEMRNIIDRGDFSEKKWTTISEDGYRLDCSISPFMPDRSERLRKLNAGDQQIQGISSFMPERTERLPARINEIDLTIHWRTGAKEKTMTLRTLKLDARRP